MSQDVDSSAADGSLTTSRDGAVLRLTLDRPSRRNSLSHTMIETLVAALTDAATDDSLRAIHIQGAGDDFCAGADWVAANSGGDQRPRTGDIVRRIPHTAHRVIELVHGIHLPVVCSVRGFAVGLGCNLALAADFTVAATDAVFWEPFADTGIQPGFGCNLATSPTDRADTRKADAVARRQGQRNRRRRLGIDPPSRKPDRTRQRDRGSADPTGRRTHGGTRTG